MFGGHAQGAAESLEDRFALVVRVLAAQVVDVQRDQGMVDEALEKLARQIDVELADVRELSARPPQVETAFVVVPAGAVGGVAARLAADTMATDARAVAAVLAAERRLGRSAQEMPHNNKGYDILSTPAPAEDGSRGPSIFIEVKGRIAGAD